jgi:hypothetical protein
MGCSCTLTALHATRDGHGHRHLNVLDLDLGLPTPALATTLGLQTNHLLLQALHLVLQERHPEQTQGAGANTSKIRTNRVHVLQRCT